MASATLPHTPPGGRLVDYTWILMDSLTTLVDSDLTLVSFEFALVWQCVQTDK